MSASRIHVARYVAELLSKMGPERAAEALAKVPLPQLRDLRFEAERLRNAGAAESGLGCPSRTEVVEFANATLAFIHGDSDRDELEQMALDALELYSDPPKGGGR